MSKNTQQRVSVTDTKKKKLPTIKVSFCYCFSIVIHAAYNKLVFLVAIKFKFLYYNYLRLTARLNNGPVAKEGVFLRCVFSFYLDKQRYLTLVMENVPIQPQPAVQRSMSFICFFKHSSLSQCLHFKIGLMHRTQS